MDFKAKTLLIDGKNMVMRNFFAFSAALSAGGVSTNLIHGSLLELFRHIKLFTPELIVVTWDSPTRSVYRRAVYPDYKAKRGQMKPDAFKMMMQQYNLYREAIAALPIVQWEVEGVEGDDLIAYMAVQQANDPQVIISTDRDFWQLVRADRVVIWEPKKKSLLTGASFAKTTGFDSPRHHLAWKCLRGDGDEAPCALKGINDEKAKGVARQLKLPVPGRVQRVVLEGYTNVDLLQNISRNFELVCLHHAVICQLPQLMKLELDRPKPSYERFLQFCQKYRLKNVMEAYDDVRKLLDRMQ